MGPRLPYFCRSRLIAALMLWSNSTIVSVGRAPPALSSLVTSPPGAQQHRQNLDGLCRELLARRRVCAALWPWRRPYTQSEYTSPRTRAGGFTSQVQE